MKNFIKSFTIFFIIIIGTIFFALSNQIGGWRIFIVSSGSMEPKIHTGSLIITKYIHPNTLQLQDIITFIPPTKQREFVTHRITQINKKNNLTTIKTKGDMNKNEDSWILAGGGVIGKVAYTIPYAGYLLSFTRTKLGIALFVLLPAVYLIMNELTYIFELIKNHRKQNIPKQEIIIIFFLFLNILLFSPRTTHAFLSDTATLTNNSFTIELTNSGQAPPCGGDTNIIISNNGAGSTNSVSVSNSCTTIIKQTNKNNVMLNSFQHLDSETIRPRSWRASSE